MFIKKSIVCILIILYVSIHFGCTKKQHHEFKLTPSEQKQLYHQFPPILQIDSSGHSNTIKQILFTNDDNYIISASYDKTIRIWDIQKFTTKTVIHGQIAKGNDGIIETIALSPNNQLLALSGYPSERGILIFKFKDLFKDNYHAARILKNHHYVKKLLFSPNNRYLASVTSDSKCYIWDIETGRIVQSLVAHAGQINDVNFSEDGSKLITCSDDATIRIWNVSNGQIVRLINEDHYKIQSAGFCSHDKYIYYTRSDNTFIIRQNKPGPLSQFLTFLSFGFWHWKPDKIISENHHKETIDCVAVSPDKKTFLASNGNQAIVYDLPSLKKRAVFDTHQNNIICASISNKGFVATAEDNYNKICIWTIYSPQSYRCFTGRGGSIWTVGFAKDGQSIAWGKTFEDNNIFKYGNLEQSLNLYPLGLGKKYRSYTVGVKPNPDYFQGINQVGDISISTPSIHKKNQVVTVMNNATIQCQLIEKHDHCSATLNQSGTIVFTGSGDGLIKAYNALTGKVIMEFVGHSGIVWGLSVSPDNQLLVSGSSDQTIKLWNILTGQNLLTLFTDINDEWVAWTPEGFYQTSANGEQYVYWHVNRGNAWNALFEDASQFKACYNKPHIIDQTLREKRIGIDHTYQTNACLERYQSQINSPSLPIPKVKYISHDNQKECRVTHSPLFIQAEAFSGDDSPLTNVWFELNNNKIPDNQVHLTIQGNHAVIETELMLTQFHNVLSAKATTELASSLPELLNIVYVPDKKSTPNLFDSLNILSIGINKDQNQLPLIDFADKDASIIIDIFRKQHHRLYKSVQNRLLINEKATKNNIWDGLTWLKTNASNHVFSMIYIAMKVVVHNKNGFLCPFDINYDNIPESAIQIPDLMDYLNTLPSTNLICLDICYNDTTFFTPYLTSILKHFNPNNRMVVMSVMNNDSIECRIKKYNHSVFVKGIISTFEKEFKADANKNHIIEFSELNHYVGTFVNQLTKGAKSVLTMDSEHNPGDFQIGVRLTY